MRTYATPMQVAGLANLLYSKGLRPGQAKAWLEPQNYVVKGINIQYDQLDACLASEQLNDRPKKRASRSKAKPKPSVADDDIPF